MMSSVKTCSKCQVEKSAGEFSKGQRYCKICSREYAKKWAQDNPGRKEASMKRWRSENRERSKDHSLKTRFGLEPGQYQLMHDSQDGKCAICGGAEASGRRLAVDHDHRTGAIRGLLCTNCNQGLGKFQDIPDLLRLAAAYLERY